MTGPAASFIALDDAALEALFEARPDLLVPAPADFAELAARASRQASLVGAVANLDTIAGVVAQALVLVDVPTAIGSLAAMLGVAEREVDAACRRLVTIGLAVRHPDARISAVANLRSGIIGPPLGLGPPIAAGLCNHPVDTLRAIAKQRGLAGKGSKAQLVAAIAAAGEPAELLDVLARLTPEAAELLDRLDGQGGFRVMLPWGWAAGKLRSPIEQLAARALVLPAEWDVWEVPLEVSIAVRGGHLVRAIPGCEPPLERVAGTSAHVEAAAVDAAQTLVRALADLLDELDAKATPILKQGGVGVAQIRRLAKKLAVDETRLALLLELALAARLVGIHGDVLRPTERSDAWRADGAAERWVDVVEAWLTTSRFPSLAGVPRAADDKPIPALVPHQPGGDGPRRAVLDIVRGAGGVSVTSLARTLAWRYPRRFADAPAGVETLAVWAVREACVLGVLGDVPGRSGFVIAAPITEALLSGGHDAALASARRSLPPVVEKFAVQADLTVIVAGELRGAVASVLADLAVRESTGAASIWRLSDASVARALDRGHAAADLVAFLERHASHGVPQAVRYLVTDVGRRHGRVRLAPAMTVVHGQEPSLMAEVQANRRCARLGLRAVAPTVLVSSRPPDEVSAALREAGFLPGVEHADGTLVIDRAIGLRAQPSRLGDPSPASTRPQATDVGQVIARLRAASGPAPRPTVGNVRGKASSKARLSLVATPPPVPTPPGRPVPAGPPAVPSLVRTPPPALAVVPPPAAPPPPPPPPSASALPWSAALRPFVGNRVEDRAEMRLVLAEAIDVGVTVELGYVNGKADFTMVEALPLYLGEHDLLALGDYGQQTYLLERLRYVMPLGDGSELELMDREGR